LGWEARTPTHLFGERADVLDVDSRQQRLRDVQAGHSGKHLAVRLSVAGLFPHQQLEQSARHHRGRQVAGHTHQQGHPCRVSKSFEYRVAKCLPYFYENNMGGCLPLCSEIGSAVKFSCVSVPALDLFDYVEPRELPDGRPHTPAGATLSIQRRFKVSSFHFL